MKGNEPPTPGARGQGTPATVTGKKRNMLEAEMVNDGRLTKHELEGEEKHALVDAEHAVKLGIISEAYRKNSCFCAYKHCYEAAKNKAQKCGEGSRGQQKARAKCPSVCMHPRCKRGFHASCWSIVHRMCERF